MYNVCFYLRVNKDEYKSNRVVYFAWQHCLHGARFTKYLTTIFYDYLTIMTKLYHRLTIDVSFTEHLTKDARLFSGTIHLQNRKIV